jgi:type III secretion system FlhB-like substrate exporter
VARGSGAIAETIIERAREAGVYVHESTELVALLMKVDLDQRIPARRIRFATTVLHAASTTPDTIGSPRALVVAYCMRRRLRTK